MAGAWRGEGAPGTERSAGGARWGRRRLHGGVIFAIIPSPSMEKPPPSLPPRMRAPASTLLDEDETRSVRQVVAGLPDRAVLTQMAGLEAGRVCGLDGPEVTFGRAPTCTHAFDEASLSRVHARIVKEEGAYVIVDAGSSNGVFVNDERVQRAALGDGDRVRLASAVTLRFQLVDEQEERALQRVYESSVKDGLTGVWNRKYLDERLRGEIAYATRHRSPLAVVIADIDHFKRVNDSYGHLVGDEVLKATAGTMRAALRTEDILARYGGEEFVVVARGVDLKGGVLLAERLRMITERRPVEIEGKTIARTISAGVATLACCGSEATVPRLLGIADERLYAAKEAGRNRVIGGET
jgi:two-component system cell cycle response regulator